MPDPVTQKNQRRQPSAHCIEDVRFRGPNAFVACVCGWINRLGGDSEPSQVESAWNEHRREFGIRAH